MEQFQSTHPHGVRLTLILSTAVQRSFNPRTRTGCDAMLLGIKIKAKSFNPRTRTGCDFIQFTLYRSIGSFNPRTRTGCDCCKQPYTPRQRSFNPRTRTGCDCRFQTTFCRTFVSIHAPARGATRVRSKCSYYHDVSIHAPARGATIRVVYFPFDDEFQSTHPHGVRPYTQQ